MEITGCNLVQNALSLHKINRKLSVKTLVQSRHAQDLKKL